MLFVILLRGSFRLEAVNEVAFAFEDLEGTALGHRTGFLRPRQIGAAGKPPVSDLAAVFRRDIATELRAKGLSWTQIARKLNTTPSVVRRAFLSQEDPLPKTTPSRPAIRTGNESSSDRASAIA
jgi:hypothetical protein